MLLVNGEVVELTGVDGHKSLSELSAEHNFVENRTVKKIEVDDSPDSDECEPSRDMSPSCDISDLQDMSFRSSMWEYISGAPSRSDAPVTDHDNKSSTQVDELSRAAVVLDRYRDFGSFMVRNIARSGILSNAQVRGRWRGRSRHLVLTLLSGIVCM